MLSYLVACVSGLRAGHTYFKGIFLFVIQKEGRIFYSDMNVGQTWSDTHCASDKLWYRDPKNKRKWAIQKNGLIFRSTRFEINKDLVCFW